ncbi:MAG: hypothetical protein IH623_26720 [Verrucomicrobia bacterium]|nr:hypothetical protein [Verrucomicrobiota bacterium]
MKKRIARLEAAHPSPDPDRWISAQDQFITASQLHRCYGTPGEPAPVLADFHPRRQAEIDAEWQEAIERAYSVAP